MGVYLYPNNTETELKNAYIWEYQEWWQPWVNTICYYPLNSTYNFTDQSWNNRDLSWTWWTIQDYNGVSCMYLEWNMYNTSLSWVLTQFTINCYYNLKTTSDHYFLTFWMKNTNWLDTDPWFFMCWDFNWRPNGYGFWVQYCTSNSTFGAISIGTSASSEWVLGTWYNWVLTWDGTTIKLYRDWVLLKTQAWTDNSSRDTIFFWFWANQTKLYISNAIIETTVRTDSDVLNYYNQTKSNYWIS
jgi:hypothetical protein